MTERELPETGSELPETERRSGEPALSFIPSPWTPASALWLLVFVFGISVLGSLAARSIIARHLGDTASSVLVGGVLLAGYLVELAIVALGARAQDASFSESVGLIRPQHGTAVSWISVAVIGALVARGFAALYASLMQRLPIELPGADANPLSLFPGGGFSVVVLVLVVVVVAPFAEEVVFRGVLLPALGARWGVVAGVVMSSALFAGLHLSAYTFVPIAAAALVFAWMVVRFRSLWPAYVAHATFNGIAVVLLFVLKAQGLM